MSSNRNRLQTSLTSWFKTKETVGSDVSVGEVPLRKRKEFLLNIFFYLFSSIHPLFCSLICLHLDFIILFFSSVCLSLSLSFCISRSRLTLPVGSAEKERKLSITMTHTCTHDFRILIKQIANLSVVLILH